MLASHGLRLSKMKASSDEDFLRLGDLAAGASHSQRARESIEVYLKLDPIEVVAKALTSRGASERTATDPPTSQREIDESDDCASGEHSEPRM